jgi:diguanylate cyclase (GGDEF)-like protein/PAS domain S-box-containing protein
MPAILVVDDALENQLSLKSLIQDMGSVILAHDGRSAVDLALQRKPDLILLDVMMPAQDGYETCRQLKAQAGTRDIPVIFITGADDEGGEEKGLALGAIDYIIKPFAPAVVRSRVRNHLALVRIAVELRAANDALHKFKAAVDCSSAAILITDRDARIEYVNAAFSEVTGYDRHEVLGQVPEWLRAGATEGEDAGPWQSVMAGKQWRGELCSARRDGTLLWQDVSIAPAMDGENTISHIVSVNSDITRRKHMEEELHRLAVTDALTGVANRRRFMEAGNHEIARAQRTGEALTLLILDIDHFKGVNDSLGHAAGDAVLQAVARLCVDVVRAVDTVGRLGGEEFAILMPVTDIAGAYALAERLRENIARAQVQWGDVPVPITVSIGVAQAGPSMHFANLMAAADDALYEAKHAGRNNVAVASSDRIALGD